MNDNKNEDSDPVKHLVYSKWSETKRGDTFVRYINGNIELLKTATKNNLSHGITITFELNLGLYNKK